MTDEHMEFEPVGDHVHDCDQCNGYWLCDEDDCEPGGLCCDCRRAARYGARGDLMTSHDDLDDGQPAAGRTGGRFKSVRQIERAAERLEFGKEAFLRSRGWDQTSQTPGCCWLWEREIDGKRVLVDIDLALEIERVRDECNRVMRRAAARAAAEAEVKP